jgi:hypothetical protein
MVCQLKVRNVQLNCVGTHFLNSKHPEIGNDPWNPWIQSSQRYPLAMTSKPSLTFRDEVHDQRWHDLHLLTRNHLTSGIGISGRNLWPKKPVSLQ